MNNNELYIEKLKAAIIEKFGRTLDAPTDFDYLSAKISEKTNEVISSSTLKRLYGYIQPSTTPRPSTLSALARYVGFTGWSDFCAAQDQDEKEKVQSPQKKEHPTKLIIFLAALILIGIAVTLIVRQSQTATEDEAKSVIDQIDTLPTAVDQTLHTPSATADSDNQKYELLLNKCLDFTNQKCLSIRSFRQSMDIITYKEFVDSVYIAFVFNVMKNYVTEQTKQIFADDEDLMLRYNNAIFIQCREICIELLREIPIDQYTEAKKAQLEEKLGAHCAAVSRPRGC